ncbi:phospholipase D domain protein [Dictyocaulus viviparus]|uniref:Phospholipase D domain protein n=1 Tax=Dictyocaulus viviparus TaxID=29172 RepID=A0A0D8XQ39_DICVI|nr:phospholipase D domain protein [Dictyocaulus viviparus]
MLGVSRITQVKEGTRRYPSGVLHTKSWVVDGKHLYVGSANFDWRSLTQVKELGIAVFNCPCLADDLRKLHKIYWKMGAPRAKIPKSWPTTYDTSAYHERPTTVPQRNGNQAVYFSASPPGFQSCHRESDIDAMVKLIDEAEKSLNMAVMDYAPTTLYLKPLNSHLNLTNSLKGRAHFRWHGRLDEAIRRAAFDRQVKVRFMLSRWSHTYARFYSYLHSLQDLSSQLQCLKINGKCIRRGSIEVRLIQVPDMQYGVIPYSRVYHNKYFVTEKAVYVGTSNWTPDYWKYTAGIGMIIRPDDISQKSFIVKQFNQIFERDWNSNYTIPLSRFDNDGNWVNRTRYK